MLRMRLTPIPKSFASSAKSDGATSSIMRVDPSLIPISRENRSKNVVQTMSYAGASLMEDPLWVTERFFR